MEPSIFSHMDDLEFVDLAQCENSIRNTHVGMYLREALNRLRAAAVRLHVAAEGGDDAAT